jgi:hypothetical protein
MWAAVSDINPATYNGYYAWDAMDTACALDAAIQEAEKEQREKEEGEEVAMDGRVVGSNGSSSRRPLCHVEHGLSTRAVLSGPGRGAIRVMGAGGPGSSNSSQLAGAGGKSLVCPGVNCTVDEEVSAVKKISVVMHVDAQDFNRFILGAFRHDA